MISSRRGGQYLSKCLLFHHLSPPSSVWWFLSERTVSCYNLLFVFLPGSRHRNYCKGSSNHHSRYGKCGNRRSGHHHGGYDSSVVSTSDMESYVDSDDDDDEDDYDDEDEDDDDEDFMEGDVDSEEERGGGGGRRGHDFDDYRSDYTSTTEETSVSRQYLRKGRNAHSNRRRSNHHGHHKGHHHHHHYRNRNNMSRVSDHFFSFSFICLIANLFFSLFLFFYFSANA